MRRRLLRRSSLCLQYITGQLDMLEHMSPWEYQEVRRVLGHGSGFDSPGFNGSLISISGVRPNVFLRKRRPKMIPATTCQPRLPPNTPLEIARLRTTYDGGGCSSLADVKLSRDYLKSVGF